MPVNNPIKIYGDASKGCLFFENSRVDPKFLGTVQAELHPTESDRIVICRTDRYQEDGVTFRKIFRRLKIARIQNEAGEYLVEDLGLTISEVVDAINVEANKTGSGSSSLAYPLLETMNFTLDETNTSILFGNGHHFGVNSIVAVEGDDGLVKIKPVNGDLELYSLNHGDVRVDGALAGNTLASVVNALNAKFSLSALGSGTDAPPVFAIEDGEDITLNQGPEVQALVGNNDLVSPTSSSPGQHGAHLWTDETIDQQGEYFTVRFSGGKQTIGFGLYSVSDGDLADMALTNNSGHNGYWWSFWLHVGSGGPWTLYGSNPSYSGGPGWSGPTSSRFLGSPAFADLEGLDEVLVKVGITDEGYAGVWYYDVDRTNDWILFARSGTPMPSGQYGLMVKMGSSLSRVTVAGGGRPQRYAVDPVAPTLYYRYIESPDGSFHYPLFATLEEAEYVDTQNGGAGAADPNIFVDEPTGTTWYSPVVGYTAAAAAAPVEAFYAAIPTEADGLHTPPLMTLPDQSYGEGTAVNLAIPTGTLVTTLTGLPGGLSYASGSVTGNVNYVSQDTTYTVTAERSNSFGSTTQTFDITVVDDAAASEIPGWTRIVGNTLAPNHVFHTERSVLQYDQTISPGQEFSFQYTHMGSGWAARLGFLNATGQASASTIDVADYAGIYWDLKFIVWNHSINNGSWTPAGWVDNSEIDMGTNNGYVFTFRYKTDGYVDLLRNGVVIASSANSFSGAKTITYATPETYTANVQIPSLVITDTVFAGDPPVGFESAPITAGTMTDATTLASDSVVALSEELQVGDRVIVSKDFVTNNLLPGVTDTLDKNYFGIPKLTAVWGSVDLHADFDAVFRHEYVQSTVYKVSQSVGNSSDANHIHIAASPFAAYYAYAIEWDGTDLHVIADYDEAKLQSEAGINDGGTFERVYTYSGYNAVRSGSLPLVIATKGGGSANLTTSGISFVDIPTVPTAGVTDWDHAVDFSGGAERMEQEGGGSTQYNPLRMGGLNATVPQTVPGFSSDDANSMPWATAVVFRSDGNNSNQHIWNMGEGQGTNNDNIYLRVSSTGEYFFGWGRDGAVNECLISSGLPDNQWHGIYIGHTGSRFNASDSTPANLAAAFDIHVMSASWSVPFGSSSSNKSTEANWSAGVTGNRMDRSFAGNFTVGGRGSNRTFNGKVASMVVTTLMKGVNMPGIAEIEMMIIDPQKWLGDYKVNNVFRYSASDLTWPQFLIGGTQASWATQVWLMGDGTSDAYAVIRNQTKPEDQNHTAIRMVSMVSNDIQTVTIPGLL